MPRRDGRRAAVLRVETRAASSRITIYFESNHTLLRVEPQSLSVRTTLREACAACMSAMVSGHETHRTGLPEDQIGVDVASDGSHRISRLSHL